MAVNISAIPKVLILCGTTKGLIFEFLSNRDLAEIGIQQTEDLCSTREPDLQSSGIYFCVPNSQCVGVMISDFDDETTFYKSALFISFGTVSYFLLILVMH